jgi:nucleotide-binding universal stress UspA family protein
VCAFTHVLGVFAHPVYPSEEEELNNWSRFLGGSDGTTLAFANKGFLCPSLGGDFVQAEGLGVTEERNKMNVLIAIDSSPSGQTVIEEVSSRPWPDGSHFCVLSVADVSGLLLIPALVNTAIEASRAVAEKGAEEFTKLGLDAIPHVIQGHPGSEIAGYAELWGADLVIIGSHGHGGVIEAVLGGVARSVVRGTSCSVEIVRPRLRSPGVSPAPMRILLATDGTEFSIEAARSVASRPWPKGSEVKVLSIAEVMLPAMEPWYVAPGLIESLRSSVRKEAEQAAAQSEQLVREAGLKTHSSVVNGQARSGILNAARTWPADLIVVGSHGRRGLNRLLMGSVAEAVALHAACSVEVIRKRAAPNESSET